MIELISSFVNSIKKKILEHSIQILSKIILRTFNKTTSKDQSINDLFRLLEFYRKKRIEIFKIDKMLKML